MEMDSEVHSVEDPGVRIEANFLKHLQKSHHICRYIDRGMLGPYAFVIMQLVGKNLSDLRRSTPQCKFTVSTSTRISSKCLDAIESVHTLGFLHRDIKPAKFAMGNTQLDSRHVYILDLGLVRKFRLRTGEIRQPRKMATFRGTVSYASVNAHNCLELGCVDDCWSWLYMSFEFRKVELPWRGNTHVQQLAS